MENIKASVFINKNKDNNIKANANVTFFGKIEVKGFKVMDSEKGLFVAMPNNSFIKDGEKHYADVCVPKSKAFNKELQTAILAQYARVLTKSQKPSLVDALKAGEEKSKEQFGEKAAPGKDVSKKIEEVI